MCKQILMKIVFENFHRNPKYFALDDEEENGFSMLANFLKKYKFELSTIDDELDTIEGDVLVIVFPNQKFKNSEIEKIKYFVQNGGGLLLCGEWGGIFDHAKWLNQIATNFNMTFNEDRICDLEHIEPTAAGRKRAYNVRIVGLNRNYPITYNVQSFVVTSGCSISPGQKDQMVAWGGPKSWRDIDMDSEFDPGEEYGWIPVMVASFFGQGRIIGLGDASVLSNDSMDDQNHQVLAYNLFAWLAKQS